MADIDGKTRRLGTVRMAGNSTLGDIPIELPVKPRKVTIDALHDILEQ